MQTTIRGNKPLGVIAKIVILLIPLIVISIFAALFTNLFITFIFCLLISLVLNPLVDYLESKGFNRNVAILIVFVIIILLIIFAFQMIIPFISEQISSFKLSYKQFQFSDRIKDVEKWIEKNIPFLKKGDIAKEIENSFKGSFSKLQDLVSDIISTVFLIIIIPFITFFILRDRILIKKGLISLVPNRYFELTINVIDKIEKQLSRYVRGWLFDAFFVGLLFGIGLSILGVDNAVILGILAGAGHLIPYAGPVVGGIPAILISIIQFGDMRMVLPIIILIAIIYVLDNSLAQPYIFSKSVDMNPITIIILLLIGFEVLGAFGALITIPIATILKVSAVETIRGFRNYKIANY